MASGSAGSIYVDLLLRDANYVQGLNRASKKTNSFSQQIIGAFAPIGAALAAAFSFDRVIQNTIDFQNEQAQLAAILKSTGNAAGYTIEQLNSMADAMSRNSTFSSGDINKAQTRLLSYAGVLGENIPRAMQSVIDQSARLGISVEQSAETVGRALEQPSKAAAALSRQGFGSYFTKETIEMLKSLEKQGRTAEAQIKILEVLEESYAGAAIAARDTLGGAISGLNNTINSLLTAEGGFPALTEFINDFSESLLDASKNSGLLKTAMTGLLSQLIDYYRIYNEISVKVAKATNVLGLRDEDVKKYEENVRKAIEAQERLGKELLKEGGDVDFYGPLLPTSPQPPKIDYNEQLKLQKELNSSYQKYEQYIRGVSSEVINLQTAEKELNELRIAGRITNEEMYTALERYEEQLYNTGKEMDEFAKSAARNIQTAFADFLFDPFKGGLDGMAKGFIDTIRRMIAEAQAAKLAKYLFGELAGGKEGSGDGAFGGFLKNIFGSFAGGFATGGVIPPGQWGVVGERGPELAFGGNTGQTIVPNGGGMGGNTYYMDNRGADSSAIARMEQSLLALAGPGVIEQRVMNAQRRGAL